MYYGGYSVYNCNVYEDFFMKGKVNWFDLVMWMAVTMIYIWVFFR
jgi:hypothetical protein